MVGTWIKRETSSLALVSLFLFSACSRRPPSADPTQVIPQPPRLGVSNPASTPEEAIFRFLTAVENRDFTSMANLYGSREGAVGIELQDAVPGFLRQLSFQSFWLTEGPRIDPSDNAANAVVAFDTGERVQLSLVESSTDGWLVAGYMTVPKEPATEWLGEVISRWKIIGTTSDAMIFIDPESMVLTDAGLRRAWYMVGYTKPLPLENGDLYDNVKLLGEFDCINRRIELQQLLKYRGSNVVESIRFGEPQWESPVPGSIGEGVFESVCSRDDR